MASRNSARDFSQLPLSFKLVEDITLDNFIVGDNDEIHYMLSHFIGSDLYQSLYLWGVSGSGKSHLLQAVCQLAAEKELMSSYLPLSESIAVPDWLDGMETFDLVCLDDLHKVAGNKEWEQALFHFYNRLKDAGGQLLMSADQAPQGLGVQLPDLLSRLSWSAVYKLNELDDEGKLQVMKDRSCVKGIPLTDEVASFILKRVGRDLEQILTTLEQLDHESLVRKRKITIPFVREIMGW
ncbi:MAG: DnaA regulatory inactivator Hda [Pseudomonadota bacterium]